MPSHPSPPPIAVPAPIRSHDDAVHLLLTAAATPLEHEVLCFVLDTSGRGNVVLTVSGAEHPNAVLDVAELVARAAEHTPARYLVVASVRPDGELEPDDDWRLDELDHLASEYHLDLLEWYVIGPVGVMRMVDQVGQAWPPVCRWAQPWVDPE